MAYLKFKSAKEMEEKINEYFESLGGEILTDSEEKPVIYKGRIVYKTEPIPPTVCGLALYIGLKSRQSLLNYQKRSKAYEDVIAHAKLRIEAYTEGRLFDRDGSRGAQFSLENNFGWKRDPQSENGGGNNLMEAIAKSAKELNDLEI